MWDSIEELLAFLVTDIPGQDAHGEGWQHAELTFVTHLVGVFVFLCDLVADVLVPEFLMVEQGFGCDIVGTLQDLALEFWSHFLQIDTEMLTTSHGSNDLLSQGFECILHGLAASSNLHKLLVIIKDRCLVTVESSYVASLVKDNGVLVLACAFSLDRLESLQCDFFASFHLFVSFF